MPNKIIIFGVGQQGQKYFDYFKIQGLKIHCVSKTGNNIKKLSCEEFYKFSEIITYKRGFLNSFDYIIVSVSPYSEYQKVLKFLLALEVDVKIIIEKPISYDIDFLKRLVYIDNVYFFLDETLLTPIYGYIFRNIHPLLIKYSSSKEKHDTDILEHVFAGFLLHENFNCLLESAVIRKTLSLQRRDLKYNISNKKISLGCNKGEMSLNGKVFFQMQFQSSIRMILSMSIENSRIIKKNFFTLRKYLNHIDNKTYEKS